MTNFHNLDLKSPLLLVIEILNECNLNCKYCYNNQRKKEKTRISFDIFEKIIDEAAELEVFDINLSGGEPFLHDDIFKFIRKIIDSDFGITIVSNGTLIDEKIASELAKLKIIPYIQISFDSSNSYIHNKTRGNYEKAFSGFMNLVKKSEYRELAPSIGIVINKFNYRTICETIEYFSNFTNRFHLMNVMGHPKLSLDEEDRNIFETCILPKLKNMAQELNISISILSDQYKKLGIERFVLQEAHIDCLAGFTSLVIGSNLEIYPCDVARHPIGKWEKKGSIKEVYERSKEIWKNMNLPWCINKTEDSIAEQCIRI